ncbi:MAG: tetratricopeptide repeat protein [Deltaproteobacteria bacterium]|nr:tetratricopeptide repeat protein [Deltaproteobacteria bacterium]
MLISAQKYIKNGRVDKAIKDYEKIVSLDPNDIRSRLKIAELYGRTGENSKAIAEYEVISKYYCNTKFFLKAIAILKQIQKLAPERKELHRQIGELNEQEGLIGNAVAEYRCLCNFYEKDGKNSELLEILKRMSRLEPRNLAVRMKCAEVSKKFGSEQEARAELATVLEVLKEQNDIPTLTRFFEFQKGLFPGDVPTAIALAELKIRSGKASEGIAALEKLFSQGVFQRELLQGLLDGYTQTGNAAGKKKVLLKLLPLEPENLSLRHDLITACLECRDPKEALDLLAPYTEKFLQKGHAEDIRRFYTTLKTSHPGDPRIAGGLKTVDEFLKKRDNPFDSIALNEMGIPAEQSLAGMVAVSSAETQPLAGLPEDPKAGTGSEEPTLELNAENIVEVDELVLEDNQGTPVGTADPGGSKASETFQVISTADEMAPGAPSELNGPVDEGFLDLDFLSDVDEKAETAATPADFSKELEEADFYLQQGLLDEAERVCRQILSSQGDFKDAQDRLEQISIRRSAVTAKGKAKRGKETSAAPGEELFDGSSKGLGGHLDLDLAGDEMLADSQKGVKTEIGQEDTETHFQLGIAFKEMGQLDEAIKEFDQAMKDPDRFVACAVLKASCLIEKGVVDAAEDYYLGILSKSGLSEQDTLVLNFELGLFYQGQNRFNDAAEKFRQVSNLDPFYRDVGEKIKEIQRQTGNTDASDSEGEEPSGTNERKDRVSYV